MSYSLIFNGALPEPDNIKIFGDGSHFDQRDRNSRKDAETPREKTLRLCVFARAFGSNEDHPQIF
jgi:hypothetical protein